jgi:hypothetical protein
LYCTTLNQRQNAHIDIGKLEEMDVGLLELFILINLITFGTLSQKAMKMNFKGSCAFLSQSSYLNENPDV